MFLGNQQARPVALRAEEVRRPRRAARRFASSTMIVSGLWLLVFIVIHVKAFRYGAEYEWPAGGRDLYRLEMENFSNPLIGRLLRAQHARRRLAPLARRLERVPVARPRPPALDAAHPRRPARSLAVLIAGGFIVIALWAYFVGGQVQRMKLDAKIPAGPDRREVGPAQVRDEAGQPGQQAQVHDHRRRHRAWPARRRRRRSASSATTS